MGAIVCGGGEPPEWVDVELQEVEVREVRPVGTSQLTCGQSSIWKATHSETLGANLY